MELKAAIRKRRSVRKYRSRDVAVKTVSEILELARLAPSAGNLQNWRFILVKDAKTKERIADAALGQLWLTEAPVLIIVCDEKERMETHYRKRGQLYGIQDCAVVASYIQLIAEDKGLNTAWIGAFDEKAVSRILGIPDMVEPEIILTLGYGAEKKFEFDREELKNICFIEKWGNKIAKKESKWEQLRKKIGESVRVRE